MSRETVLSLLLAHPGEYLSGAAMSRTLGVSRAAVWKAIEALRQEGYEITSAPNRGYRLESAPDRVREGELSGHLAGCSGGEPACSVWTPSTPPTRRPSARLWRARRRAWWCWRRSRPAAGAGWAAPSSPPGAAGLYLTALLRPQLPP